MNGSHLPVIQHSEQKKTTSMIVKCRVRETPACWSTDKPVWWKYWPKQAASFRRKRDFHLVTSHYQNSEVQFISSCSAMSTSSHTRKYSNCSYTNISITQAARIESTLATLLIANTFATVGLVHMKGTGGLFKWKDPNLKHQLIWYMTVWDYVWDN